MDATPIQRTMLALAFAADAEFQIPFMNDCTSATTSYNYITNKLQEMSGVTQGQWDVVWGPAVFSFPGTLNGRYIDNLIYVARKGSDNEYAIAIAGTDARSWDDWVFEDFLVGKMVPWPFSNGPSTDIPSPSPSPSASAGDAEAIQFETPSISLGTFLGLSILLNAQVCCEIPGRSQQLPGGGMQLLPFLASIVNDQPVNIYTTGHSLGGALSPTLALALMDMRSQWDPNERATILPFSFAGPTPGNFNFASYLRSRLPNLQRIWNGLDVVPNAWDTAHLKQIPALYGLPAPPDIQAIVDVEIYKLNAEGYEPLNSASATFNGPLQPGLGGTTPDERFMKQAAWQHIIAYQQWAGIENWFSSRELGV